MCGRYTHKLTWAEIVKLYQLILPDLEPAGFKTSYNVAPTDVMPIIRPAGNGRELIMAKWGLVLTPPRKGVRFWGESVGFGPRADYLSSVDPGSPTMRAVCATCWPRHGPACTFPQIG